MLFVPAVSAAQTASDAGVTTRVAATPPSVSVPPTPVHPAGFETEERIVGLSLVVGVDGVPREVTVITPVGDGFDAQAIAAAEAMRFEPARRGETPIAARIRYDMVFRPVAPAVVDEPVTEESSPDAAPLERSIAGRVTGADGALAGVTLTVSSEDGVVAAAETDAEGRFTVALADGSYRVTLRADLHRTLDRELVVDGDLATLAYTLVPVDDDELLSFSARAVVEPPPRDATRRTLSREVLTRIPGTRGDALRVVELLPGVGRPPFGAGFLIVRGAAPGDSEVFLNGSSVPLLYHFGGLTSFFNSSLLERIDFVPGNFSVRYGRRIGGILEVDPRDPRTDGVHGYADVNLLDASFAVEAGINENFSIAIAARRSYIDFFFNEIVPDGIFNIVAAPVYYDYQLLASWRPTAADRVRFFLYGSSDELSLVFGQPSGPNPNIRGSFGFVTQFHRAQLSYRHVFSPSLEQETMVSFGWNQVQFGIGDTARLELSTLPFQARSEWRAQLVPNVRLIGGLDIGAYPTSISFRGARPAQSEGRPTQASQGVVEVDQSATAYRPAVYLESNVTMFDRLDAVVGVRTDFFRDIQRWTVDPRMTFRYRVMPELNIRGGAGVFSQAPEFQESAPNVGNPNLRPIRALHFGLGTDLRFQPQGVSVTVDGFYKHIEDRVVTDSSTGQFVNQGLGRIYGLEVGARLEPGGPLPLIGFLSYTLMRSERQDAPDQAWRLFDYDQTHIFTLSLVWTIGDGWEAGATLRLVSGNPYTPITGSVNDLSTGTYRPIYGAVNSARNPLFNRLDVRVQKQFVIGDFRLSVYLDVQNVFNSTNREGTAYSYDYSQTSDIGGLPIIPSLGLRGEL